MKVYKLASNSSWFLSDIWEIRFCAEFLFLTYIFNFSFFCHFCVFLEIFMHQNFFFRFFLLFEFFFFNFYFTRLFFTFFFLGEIFMNFFFNWKIFTSVRLRFVFFFCTNTSDCVSWTHNTKISQIVFCFAVYDRFWIVELCSTLWFS